MIKSNLFSTILLIFFFFSFSFVSLSQTDERELTTIQLTDNQLEVVKALTVPAGIYLTVRPEEKEEWDEYSKYSSAFEQKPFGLMLFHKWWGESTRVSEIGPNDIIVSLDSVDRNSTNLSIIISKLWLPPILVGDQEVQIPYYVVSDEQGHVFALQTATNIGTISYACEEDKKFINKLFPNLLN